MFAFAPPAARWCRSCAVALCASVAAVSAAAEPAEFPVTVRVAATHTYLRSGPSEDFYPTERLPTGATLEVWAVDPAGWCAVRPVAGGFSWIRAEEVACTAQPDGGTVDAGAGQWPREGVIVSDGAVARIGSQINDLRHVAQVRLEAGERIRVIEEVRIASGRHAGAWAKIEPPAGEFRWARAADLELPPQLAALVPEPDTSAVVEASAAEAVEAITQAGKAITLAVNEARDATAGTPGEPPALEPVPFTKRMFSGWLPMGTSVFDTTPRPAAPVAAANPGVATDELADIDLALSLAVAGPSESWNLPQVRERLRKVAAKTTSQADRLRAEALDARLARFEQIQARQQAIATGPSTDTSPLRLGSMWSSLAALGTRPIRPGVFPGGVPADGRPTWTPPDVMETTGRLATVVSRRPDAPRWAIVDGNNTVLAFVTPQAGVNLAPLVGQEVAVRGPKGYMPEYKRPYIVASDARPRIAATPAADGDVRR